MPKRILVVEDDESILELERRILEDAGYQVDCATSGAAALELVKANTYTLVVADVMMPGMDGFDLTKEIKKLHPKGLPILLVTAMNNALKQARLKEAKVTSALQKPFTQQSLLTAVRMLEGQRQSTLPREPTGGQKAVEDPPPKAGSKTSWIKKLFKPDS